MDLNDGSIAIVTIGAEDSGSPAAIDVMTAAGITVSVGHTAPTASQAQAAFDAGANMVTHLYNATDHPAAREPGLVGTALMRPDVRVGLIADLVHVHRTMLKMAFELKGPGGVVLVTDAIAWRAGKFDGRTVSIRNGAPCRALRHFSACCDRGRNGDPGSRSRSDRPRSYPSRPPGRPCGTRPTDPAAAGDLGARRAVLG
jgi:N-acetylglucosamine-6-phosphate deacetylase